LIRSNLIVGGWLELAISIDIDIGIAWLHPYIVGDLL